MGLPPAGALQVFNPTPKVKLFFKSMITELLRSHTPESNIPSKKTTVLWTSMLNTALMAYIGSSINVSIGVILELKILKHVHTQNELLSDDNQNSHGNVPCEPQNKLKGSHAILHFTYPFCSSCLSWLSYLPYLSISLRCPWYSRLVSLAQPIQHQAYLWCSTSSHSCTGSNGIYPENQYSGNKCQDNSWRWTPMFIQPLVS